jgi:hypothetical protein
MRRLWLRWSIHLPCVPADPRALPPDPHTTTSWGTAVGSAQRAKASLNVLQGPLDGHAVAIVESKGACAGWSPAMPPSHGGSQAFIFHAKVGGASGKPWGSCRRAEPPRAVLEGARVPNRAWQIRLRFPHLAFPRRRHPPPQKTSRPSTISAPRCWRPSSSTMPRRRARPSTRCALAGPPGAAGPDCRGLACLAGSGGCICRHHTQPPLTPIPPRLTPSAAGRLCQEAPVHHRAAAGRHTQVPRARQLAAHLGGDGQHQGPRHGQRRRRQALGAARRPANTNNLPPRALFCMACKKQECKVRIPLARGPRDPSLFFPSPERLMNLLTAAVVLCGIAVASPRFGRTHVYQTLMPMPNVILILGLASKIGWDGEPWRSAERSSCYPMCFAPQKLALIACAVLGPVFLSTCHMACEPQPIAPFESCLVRWFTRHFRPGDAEYQCHQNSGQPGETARASGPSSPYISMCHLLLLRVKPSPVQRQDEAGALYSSGGRVILGSPDGAEAGARCAATAARAGGR